MAKNRLTIKAHLDQIQHLSNLVQEFSLQTGFDDSGAYACALAVAEACENIILHGYGRECEFNISVAVQVIGNMLCIELEDSALPFNPATKPVDMDWSQDNPPVGGLGLHMIHSVMDDVGYRRTNDQNILKLCKVLPNSASSKSN